MSGIDTTEDGIHYLRYEVAVTDKTFKAAQAYLEDVFENLDQVYSFGEIYE